MHILGQAWEILYLSNGQQENKGERQVQLGGIGNAGYTNSNSSYVGASNSMATDMYTEVYALDSGGDGEYMDGYSLDLSPEALALHQS